MLRYRGGTGWETERMDNWRGGGWGGWEEKGKGEKRQEGMARKWVEARRVHKVGGGKERKERGREG